MYSRNLTKEVGETWGADKYGRGGQMPNNGEIIRDSIMEFSRIQDYMELVETGSQAYLVMKRRYVDLKVILTSLGVNVTEIDRIKE